MVGVVEVLGGRNSRKMLRENGEEKRKNLRAGGSGHAPSLKASHNKEIRHDVKRLYFEMGVELSSGGLVDD